MPKRDKPYQLAILLYPGVTALDAIGPYEVFSRLPDAEVRFVGKATGSLIVEGHALSLSTSHSFADTPSPELVLVPGGTTTPSQMVDDETLDWLRQAHETTEWTTSVCTGALILGAAGILKGLPATTHWYKMGVLRIMGAHPQPEQRIVRAGKVVTAAGVSAGIDLALCLAGAIAGSERAQAIQLAIEYDPHPPFQAGHMSKATRETQQLARAIMDERMPADQRHFVPRIAWRRVVDLIRTGR